MKQILIPNGTGPSNIGDMVMLMVLKNLIQKHIPGAKITIHSTEPQQYEHRGVSAKHTLYSYVAFANRNNLIRLARLVRLSLYYLIFKWHMDENISLADPLYKLCLDYKKADSIVFVGGGYLRSKPGITQTLNLLMQLIMVSFAKLFNNKKIISPISFGPFAHEWQEAMAAKALDGIDLVAAREMVSFNKLKEHKVRNVILSSDHALLLQPKLHQSKPKTKIIGFTLRKWFKPERQAIFESEVAGALSRFALGNGFEVLPVVQVDSPTFGEDDLNVSVRVSRQLRQLGVSVKPTIKVTNLASAKDIYASLDLLLGMRMHSNIIAATQGVPFVAVSYEHKTEGIAKLINMEKYCIRSDEVDKNNLYQLLVDVNKNKKYIHTTLTNAIKDIQGREIPRWGNFLAS